MTIVCPSVITLTQLYVLHANYLTEEILWCMVHVITSLTITSIVQLKVFVYVGI